MPNDDLLYSRQETLQLTVPDSVTVIGLGGIGSWVAILAAMSGVKKLFLFDDDLMEEHNRNRLPFCQGSLNQPKVQVVKNYIDAIRPEATVIGMQERLDGIFLDLQLSIDTVFMDCTDSPKSQFKINRACKKAERKYIRAGYDGTHITVTNIINGWMRIDEEDVTYTVAPSWVVPAVTVAALAVGKLMKYPNQQVSLDISEIGIPVLQKKGKRITKRCVNNQVNPPAPTLNDDGTYLDINGQPHPAMDEGPIARARREAERVADIRAEA